MKYGLMLIIAALAFSQGAWAGNKDGNGGDPVKARERKILNLVQGGQNATEGSLRQRVCDTVHSLDVNRVSDDEVRRQLTFMIENNLLSFDAWNSPYSIQSKCVDIDGVEQAATTKMDKIAASICLNAHRLAEENASENEIIALLIHESAHHLGFEDRENRINAAILELMQPEVTAPAPIPPSSDPFHGMKEGKYANSQIEIQIKFLSANSILLTSYRGSAPGTCTNGACHIPAFGSTGELSLIVLSPAVIQLNEAQAGRQFILLYRE